MEEISLAEMADFNENINPADRRAKKIADYLALHGFNVTPLRNISIWGWLGVVTRKFDILHTRGWPIERYIVHLLPHRYHVHTIIGHYKGESRSYTNIKKWLCKKADIIHIGYLISKKIVMKEYGISEDKIKLIHNPIDTDLFKPRAHYNERLQVLFISSYIDRKNPQLIPLLAKNFSNIDFYMYGSHTDSVLFKKIFNESEKSSNLFVNKPVDYYKLPAIYQNADIFVFPSVQGEFGNVVIEALSSGLPVISLKMGSEEIINHGKNGFLCNNLNDFKKYIQYLADNKELRLTMGKEARKTALKDFSQEIIYQRYLDMYKGLVED